MNTSCAALIRSLPYRVSHPTLTRSLSGGLFTRQDTTARPQTALLCSIHRDGLLNPLSPLGSSRHSVLSWTSLPLVFLSLRRFT